MPSKRIVIFGVALSFFLLVSTGFLPGAFLHAQTDHAVVLRCGQAIDVQSGKLISQTNIVVRGNKIEQMGKDIAAPAGSTVVDLSGATCLPGLMDMHAHIMYTPGGGTDGDYLFHSSAYKALHGMKRAQEFLQQGFTTLRDPGDCDKYFANVEIRDAIARGDYIGPRLFIAPHYLTATGGHGDLNDVSPDVANLAAGVIVSGPDSAREAVRNEIKYGADWIKLFVSGGVMSAHDDLRVQQLTDAEVQAAVDEAHRYKKKVAVHAHSTDAIKTSIRAGVDSVEHGTLIDDEGIQLMKEHGTYLDPTLYVLNYIIEEGPKMGIPQGSIDKGLSIQAERNRNIRKAFVAGVKVILGSDTLFPVSDVPREFNAMVQLGLTPMQAIQAATITPATMLGIQQETGSLQTGKEADIVAVSQNPLQDVTALEHVKFVMKGGQIVRNDF